MGEYNTDNEWVDRIRGGDEQAFVKLINNFQEPVLRTCMGFLHNNDDAQDITQEVFVEVFESIDKFRGDAKLSTWIYRIAVNKSLNYIRNSKKRSFFKNIESLFTVSDDSNSIEVADDNAEPHEQMENKETAEVLKKAINSLAKNQQIAFTMHKYEDLSYKQIAEIMDVSLSSIESLIHRAKVNLQKKLVNHYKQ